MYTVYVISVIWQRLAYMHIQCVWAWLTPLCAKRSLEDMWGTGNRGSSWMCSRSAPACTLWAVGLGSGLFFRSWVGVLCASRTQTSVLFWNLRQERLLVSQGLLNYPAAARSQDAPVCSMFRKSARPAYPEPGKGSNTQLHMLLCFVSVHCHATEESFWYNGK